MIDAIRDFLLMTLTLVALCGAMLVVLCMFAALAVWFGILDAVAFDVKWKTTRRLRDHDEGPEQ